MLKWLSLGALIAVLDQWTKAMVTRAMDLGDLVPVLPFFSLVRWHNEGAAFSMLSDAAGWQRWFFVVLAIGFLAFIVFELRRLPDDQKMMGWVYGLIAGGAAGNLIDRALQGHVVDFLLLHYQRFYFPAFNVADIALSIGAGLWIWLMLSDYLRDRRKQAPS
jgi:signal peptidase II